MVTNVVKRVTNVVKKGQNVVKMVTSILKMATNVVKRVTNVPVSTDRTHISHRTVQHENIKNLHQVKHETAETSSTSLLRPHRNNTRKVSSLWPEVQNILSAGLFSIMHSEKDHSCGYEVWCHVTPCNLVYSHQLYN